MANESTFGNDRVLVVDDHHVSRRFAVEALRQTGCSVKQATCVRRAVGIALDWRPGIVVTDWNLTDGTGGTLVQECREQWPARVPFPRFILVSGESAADLESKTASYGFDQVLGKPFIAPELAHAAFPPTGNQVQETRRGCDDDVRLLFRRELEQRLPELEQLVIGGQTIAATAITHQLLASSAICGANTLEAAIRALDCSCRGNPEPAVVAQRWCSLSAAARDYLAGAD